MLKAIQPEVVELTTAEYEERMGAGPAGEQGKKTEDVGQPMGTDTTSEDGAPFRGTRADALKILKERGFDYKDLKRKTKKELIEML